MPGLRSYRALLAVPIVAMSALPLRLSSAAAAWHAPGAASAGIGRSLAILPPAAVGAARWLGSVPGSRPVRVGVVLAPAHPRALAAFAAAVSTPSSDLYHHFLTAAALQARFGPAPSLVQADRRALEGLGFRYLGRQGFVLYASAPAAVVERALGVGIRVARYRGLTLTAPDGRVHVPKALADVQWVTGLVQAAGPKVVMKRRSLPGSIQRIASTRRRPKPLGATLVDGFSATSVVVGPSSVPTGLPITIRTTVEAPTGGGDTSARLGDYAVDTGPGGQYLGGVQVDGPDASGNIATTFTAYAPGTYALSATIRPGPGLPPQIIALPPVTFTGTNALEGPIDAAQMTSALDATQVVAASARTPAAIAVFSTTNPAVADVAAFARQNGLEPLRLKVVPVDGGTSPGANDGGELSLDLESLDTAAPGASVYIYTTPQTYTSKDTFVGVMNAVAANDNVSVLTMSYAQPEVPGGDEVAIEDAVAALNAEGVTVVAGAGDNGAFGTGATAQRAVVSPADTPAVTAVGGADLRVSTSGGQAATAYWGSDTYAALDPTYLSSLIERGGGEANVLGGGGYSQFFSAPSWQAALVRAAPGGSGGGRGLPDIAMPASPEYPGLAMVLQGQPSVGGGTSMAAPLFAGYLADMAAEEGARLGNVNPDLYAAAKADPRVMLQPIDGYDGEWTLGAGIWNPLTGLGTPDIDRLAQDLLVLHAPVVKTLAASWTAAQKVSVGQGLTVVFTATTPGGELAVGVPLKFAVTGSLPASALSARGAVTNAFGQASVTFDDPSGPATGVIVAKAPDGVVARSGTITVRAPKLVALAFAEPSATGVAGQTTELAMQETSSPVGARPLGVRVRVAVTGPHAMSLTATLGTGGVLGLRLVRTGLYRIHVSVEGDARIESDMNLDILPGEPARYILRQSTEAHAGTRFASRLTAYDAFGNVDSLATGTVLWIWRVDAHTYHGESTFHSGVATAAFVPAAHVLGPVRTTYRVGTVVNA